MFAGVGEPGTETVHVHLIDTNIIGICREQAQVNIIHLVDDPDYIFKVLQGSGPAFFLAIIQYVQSCAAGSKIYLTRTKLTVMFLLSTVKGYY